MSGGLETNPANECICRYTDAWRCAGDQNLIGGVSCYCQCHRAEQEIKDLKAQITSQMFSVRKLQARYRELTGRDFVIGG